MGTSSMIPLASDWNGDGIDTIGVFDPSNAQWWLKDVNQSGAPVTHAFTYGFPGGIPLAGDWTGKGYDSPGVYDPNSGVFYLKNTNASGNADSVVAYGPPHAITVAGHC